MHMKGYAGIYCKDIMRVVSIMKALVYLRVSTEEQAEKGYSLKVQKLEGMNKAVEMGCSPEDIYIFSDEGVSGAILERPQLMAALDLLKKRNTEYFICYDGSRLSRNAAHQLILIDQIKKSGAKLIFLKNIYQDNAEGRFQLTVMAAVDEYERARLKLRTEMGKRAKAAQHELTHNPGLYGYDFDPKTDTLNINENNALILRSMFEMLINEGKGPSEIAEQLNASNVPSPRMKQWSRVTVRRILANQSYLGTLYIRRYDTRDCHLNKFKSKEEKLKVRERPQDEWVPVRIPQLVDRKTWEKAQSILKKPQSTKKRKSSTDFLLTPLLKCSLCGSNMKGKSITRNGCQYRYYICSGKYKSSREEKCTSRLVKADDLEKAVWDYICGDIKSYISSRADEEKIIEKYLLENQIIIKNIFNKKEKAKKENERIILMFQKGYINEAIMQKKLEELKKREMLLDLESAAKSDFDVVHVKKYLPIIIEDMLSKLDNKERRHVMETLISGINVYDDTVYIKGKL